MTDGGADGGADSGAPLYRVENSVLRDRQGRQILLRGINIPNDWDQRGPEKVVKPPEETFKFIADSGFNAIRLVIEWYQIEKVKGVYSQEYLELFRKHVQWATEAGLYVIVDMHQDLFGRGFNGDGAPYWACDQSNYDNFHQVEPWIFNYFSEQVKNCFDGFWRTFELRRSHESAARAAAELVSGYDRVLGFDTFNEPSVGNTDFETFERQFLMAFHKEFAKYVGEGLKGRAYFFEPAVTFGVASDSTMPAPVTTFTGVFAPHYYNTSIEFDHKWDGVVSQVQDAVDKAAGVAKRMKTPWGYGEMGGVKETVNFPEYLFTLYRMLDEQTAGSFMWLYEKGETGFGLIDAATNNWHPSARAFLRPAPALTAGTISSIVWDYDNLKFSFSWEENPAAGDSEIIVPEWVSRVGFDMVLDGKQADPAWNDRKNRVVISGGRGGTRSLEIFVKAPYPD
jgi:endoglycosylceramidase